MLKNMKYFALAAIVVSGYLGAMQPEEKPAIEEEKVVAIRTYNQATDRDATKAIFAEHPENLFVNLRGGGYDPERVDKVYTYLIDREDPERYTKVLTADGDIKGLLTYYFLESRKKKGEKHQGYIELLAVTDKEPEPMRTNYENRLLSYAIQQIKANEPDKITTFVRKTDTRMIDLLHKAGFRDLNGKPASSIQDTSWEVELAEPKVEREFSEKEIESRVLSGLF